jgi:glutamine cyclotransferase
MSHHFQVDWRWMWLLALTGLVAAACGGIVPASPLPAISPIPTVVSPMPTPTQSLAAPIYGYRVVNTYPHDPAAFTQGLVFDAGTLYEGTGLEGQSSVRRVNLASGQVLQSRALAPEYFGEGLTVWGEQLIQLTWQSRVGFVYDKTTFRLIKQFTYPTEGWGLTQDGTHLIMSDGTAHLYFLDPGTLTETRRITVTDRGAPVVRLNELEYIRGEIFANIWQTDRIARIAPDTGEVVGWIDLTGLLGAADRAQPVDVLNGIAYDAEHDRLVVTGKLWPRLLEITLIPPP